MGGKRRFAPMIWERLGNPDVYAEPFLGSAAVLLARPGGAPKRGREVVCDRDAYVANFWRAMQADPEAVADAADWPTFHQDLTARQRWLIAWADEHADRVSADPDFYDARAAGWWAWGMSNWIGSGFCRPRDRTGGDDVVPAVRAQGVAAAKTDKIPMFNIPLGGKGTQAQRLTLPEVSDKRPVLSAQRVDVGRGTAAQRRYLPEAENDKRPSVPQGGGRACAANRDLPELASERRLASRPNGGGSLTAQSRTRATDDEHYTGGGARLLPWFRALQARLFRVYVLNRSWESAVTPTVLLDTETTAGKSTIGVFLDPPYRTAARAEDLYRFDDGDRVAEASWQWALEHGDRHRVAYACLVGDVEVPDGWTAERMALAGYSGRGGRTDRKQDQVLFSPACEGQRAWW